MGRSRGSFGNRGSRGVQAPKSQPGRKTEAREEESREGWREGGPRLQAESLGQTLWLGHRAAGQGPGGAATQASGSFQPRRWASMQGAGLDYTCLVRVGGLSKVSRLSGKWWRGPTRRCLPGLERHPPPRAPGHQALQPSLPAFWVTSPLAVCPVPWAKGPPEHLGQRRLLPTESAAVPRSPRL